MLKVPDGGALVKHHHRHPHQLRTDYTSYTVLQAQQSQPAFPSLCAVAAEIGTIQDTYTAASCFLLPTHFVSPEQGQQHPSSQLAVETSLSFPLQRLPLPATEY